MALVMADALATRLIEAEARGTSVFYDLDTPVTVRSSSAYAGYGDQNALQDLYQQLEALPAVQAYRAAERALAGLLQAVDEAISTTACVEFAVNAVRSGCGCGG